MKWFGQDWGAPLCQETERTSTPVGTNCTHCDEPIIEGEQGTVSDDGHAYHYECMMRSIVGSLSHVLKVCSCYVPNAIEDSDLLSKRVRAKLAVRAWEMIVRRHHVV